MTPQPFVPAPLTAQVEMIYQQNNQTVENVYHVVGTAPWDATSLNALGTWFHNWEANSAAAQRHMWTALTNIKVRDISVEGGTGILQSGVVNSAIQGVALPNNCTLAIEFGTGFTGRSNRGRTYWVGLAQSQLEPANSAQTLTNAAANAILTAVELLVTPSGAAMPNGGRLAVVSKRLNKAWRQTAQVTPIINARLVDMVIDSQRRRLPNHNRHG